MVTYGMLIDLKSCIGCKACMTACKGNHDIPFGEHDGREYYRIWPLEVELGVYPYTIRNMTPMLCMHCQDPPCQEVCPIPGAIYQRHDGIVLIDEERCNACKLCIPACPYGALYFRDDKGAVDKCTFCVEGVDNGLEPECVKACPTDAMFFGDLSDPESHISKLIRGWDARPLYPEHGTNPAVYYTAHAGRLKGTIENKKRGCAVPGATVTVLCAEKDESQSTCAGSDGCFFFWDLKVREQYSVRIEADGFVPSTRELYLDKEYTDLGKIVISEL